VWATVARIPQQTTVTGVVRAGNNVTVVSPAEGSVVELPLAPGDPVKKGEAVAVVRPFDGGEDVEVTAMDGGVVREEYVDLGDGVGPGEALMVIRPAGSVTGDRRVVVYVAPLVAHDFRPGTVVSVQVPDVATGTDQQLIAEVERIAAVRTSMKGIAAEVESSDLAESLFQEADGSPYRVDLRLRGSDKANVASQVFDGQVVEVVLTYANPHPIQLLFGG
jgi:pyruvate/2-oxoglutarate dehydrogenase complex dihydrolipoamide acyltransferase (E2) component